jgi:hypothetical protein
LFARRRISTDASARTVFCGVDCSFVAAFFAFAYVEILRPKLRASG